MTMDERHDTGDMQEQLLWMRQARQRAREREPQGEQPPMKEHPPELVVCAWCGVLIEDGWFPYHPCEEREKALRERR